MGCCCGCPGTPCPYCSGATPKAYFASISGISIATSGACFNFSTPNVFQSAIPTYSGTYTDPSGCITLSTGCLWASPTPLLPFSSDITVIEYLNAGCTGATGSVIIHGMSIALGINATQLIAEVEGTIAAGSGSGFFFFRGVNSITTPIDCMNGTWTFTNSLSLGSTFTPLRGGNGIGIGTGGSMTVIFKKSCCP